MLLLSKELETQGRDDTFPRSHNLVLVGECDSVNEEAVSGRSG